MGAGRSAAGPMPATAISLICNPADPALDEDSLDEAAFRLLEAFETEVKRRILAEDVAAEFLIDGRLDRKAIDAAFDGLFDGRPVDIVVQPAARREKRLLIADMDSTIIEQECLDELADFAGLKAEIAAITEHAMRGELDFEAALKTRVGMLKGLPEALLGAAYAERITLTPGAETLVATMKARGAATALVSGGFTYFVERVAARAGFAETRANRLIIEGGALTGAVAEPILGRAAKEEALVEIAAAHGVPLKQSLAVGDGANDLSMLGRAGLGVAFRAKPAVAAAAHADIRHGDLTALLYLQGIPQAEFQAPARR